MFASILSPHGHLSAIGQIVTLFTRHGELAWEMTKRELSDRYAGQVLGTLWAVGHPIFFMLLYVFVFGMIFKSRFEIDEEIGRSYAVYILSGLIPWLTFGDAMKKGAQVLEANSALVKQVVFPIEILPVSSVFSSFVTQLVAGTALILYLIFSPQVLPWTAVFLPVLFVFQLFAMIGVSYVLSSVGVFLRDLRELVSFFTTAGMWMAPIIFPPALIEQMPEPFVWLLLLNPFSHLVWCYQDVLYFGEFLHPVSWVIVAVLSVVAFYGGYRVFRRLKTWFGEVL